MKISVEFNTENEDDLKSFEAAYFDQKYRALVFEFDKFILENNKSELNFEGVYLRWEELKGKYL